MATELRNMRITYISLVKQGANRKGIILKSGDTNMEKTLSRVQKDDKKKIVYGVVYAPDEVDTQDEFATKEEIEKAAWEFMKDLRNQNVDTMHNFEKAGAYVAESWLIKGRDSLFPEEKEGTWCVGIKIEDDTLWKSLEAGEFEGLSMAGVAERIRKDAPAESFWEGFFNVFKRFQQKDNNNSKGGQMPDSTSSIDSETFAKQIAPLFESAIKKAMEPVEQRISALEDALKVKKSADVGGQTGDDYGSLL